MPGDSISKHPSGLTMYFTESDHVYRDEYGTEYVSGTTLIHRAFPEFDSAAISAKCAKRQGVDQSEILADWEARNRAGTRAHENCEYQILGQYDRMHAPEDETERVRFAAAWEEVEKIRAAGFQWMRPEYVVFSPRFLIAGSIDLLCCRDDQNYLIVDWKYLKKMRYKAFRDEVGTIRPTAHLPNCNYYHYAMQLNVYEFILKAEGYIPVGADVRKVLNWYNSEAGKFENIGVRDMPTEAAMLAAWNVTCVPDGRVPF